MIGFNRSEFRLVERNFSYSLSVDVRSGFLPQSITLGLDAVPGTACEGVREGGRERGRV